MGKKERSFNLLDADDCLCVCHDCKRQLVKSKAPAGAKTKEEKQKGLTLFGQKPPTPKLLRVFGNFRKGGILDRLKVKSLHFKPTAGFLLSSFLFKHR